MYFKFLQTYLLLKLNLKYNKNTKKLKLKHATKKYKKINKKPSSGIGVFALGSPQ